MQLVYMEFDTPQDLSYVVELREIKKENIQSIAYDSEKRKYIMFVWM